MSSNEDTVVFRLPKHIDIPFSFLFQKHFEKIRTECSETKDDLVVFAFEGSLSIGSQSLSRHSQDIKTTIIGRHSQCPLRLLSPSISLRHAILILYPQQFDFQYQLIDLNSTMGFSLEEEESTYSIWANGAVFFRIQQYSFFIIPPKQFDWKQQKDNIWQQLSTRNYEWSNQKRISQTNYNILKPDPVPEAPSKNTLDLDDKSNSISIQRPPLWLNEANIDEPSACLEIIFKEGLKRIFFNEEMLERGVLIGRYERCGVSLQACAEFNPVSRVHCLLLYVMGTTYIIDTASTNGTCVFHEHITQKKLIHRAPIILAETLIMSWKQI